MMGLSDGRKSFPIGLAVLIQYRSVTDTQPPSHVAVAITLNAQASSLKSRHFSFDGVCSDNVSSVSMELRRHHYQGIKLQFPDSVLWIE